MVIPKRLGMFFSLAMLRHDSLPPSVPCPPVTMTLLLLFSSQLGGGGPSGLLPSFLLSHPPHLFPPRWEVAAPLTCA